MVQLARSPEMPSGKLEPRPPFIRISFLVTSSCKKLLHNLALSFSKIACRPASRRRWLHCPALSVGLRKVVASSPLCPWDPLHWLFSPSLGPLVHWPPVPSQPVLASCSSCWPGLVSLLPPSQSGLCSPSLALVPHPALATTAPHPSAAASVSVGLGSVTHSNSTSFIISA